MGTWGPGNLQNDYALDELSTRSAELVESLVARARRKTSREADEWDYTTLFVEFEILFAFDTAGLLNTSRLPSAAEIEALRDEWLVDWDAYIDQLSPSERFKSERRAIIEQCFQRFAAISTAYHGE